MSVVKYYTLLLSAHLIFNSCNTTKSPSMDSIAESYVRLVLEVGQYESDFVDAYYGPEEWKPVAAKQKEIPSADFISRASGLLKQCDEVDTTGFSKLENARLSMFRKQLTAVKTKLDMMAGKTYSFDEEAKLLYDAEPPHLTEAFFDSLLADLNALVPGEGDLSRRYNNFADQFVIPKDKLDTVFKVTIREARKRTSQYIPLPANENFVLEYVTNKNWSGYNYYQGKSQSLIQINTDLPIFIHRAVDLACHEGYPGHHVLNVLLEQNLVESKGWKEFSVYPLFSPMSLIAEGSANYGIEMVFPGEERVKYEKEVLFTLAGLDSTKADLYGKIQGLMTNLKFADNEAARKYLNGEISREEAAKMIEKYLLFSPDRALQRTRFFDQYRSYVINYNLGLELVTRYVVAKGGTPDQPQKRWEIFRDLLSNPYTASSMK